MTLDPIVECPIENKIWQLVVDIDASAVLSERHPFDRIVCGGAR
jgi:hypothetical protein